ncbi:MAG: hypothetical protein KGJ84_01015 [Elusimicrobia bacterium]|nr:hypothetical protein [Elusimicrobiota bacterium]
MTDMVRGASRKDAATITDFIKGFLEEPVRGKKQKLDREGAWPSFYATSPIGTCRPIEKPRETLDGHFTVARVGPSALWLNAEDADDDTEIGPVQVPPQAAKLFRAGDRLSAAVGKMSGFWKLLETGGVYPG